MIRPLRHFDEIELMMHALQRRSRAQKIKRFYNVMQPTKDDTLIIFGSGNGMDFLPSYPWPQNVVAVDINPQALHQLKMQWPDTTTLQADLCHSQVFPFRPGAYDVGYSNAVLEHLADPEAAADTIRSLCKSYYVTTPNALFPFDMHTRLLFFHWLPERVQRWIIKTFKPGNYKDGIYERVRPLTPAKLHRLFPDATIHILFPGYVLVAEKQ